MTGGPTLKGILDFLASLPEHHLEQKYVFLCSNHDFAFAAFMGVLPTSSPGMNYTSTRGEYIWRFSWWQGRCVSGCYHFINLE